MDYHPVCMKDHLIICGKLLEICREHRCIFLTDAKVTKNCALVIKQRCKPSAMYGG